MAFCVCAMSLSTVSCGKLEDDINTLKGQVENLTLRLAELESKLNTEVANLNAAIAAVDAKVAVVKVEEKDGMVVLTLANGSTLNVGKPDANANNTGLVTTVTKDGKMYWALVKNDGTVENLNVEVGHPDVKLSFKVDAETKNLLISYDGKNYESTGVVVKNPDDYKHIVSNFEEGEDYVVFTIGDKQYKLPKYENAGAVLLGRTDMFVLPGASKTITLSAEGVTECYVMSKPDGWKATLADGTLTVSAPSQAVVDFGACETEGQVLVHATTAGGKCVVAPLNVKTGDAVRLEYKNGNVTVFNALTATSSDGWGGTFTDFATITVGITPASDFKSFETDQEFYEYAYANDLGSGFSNIVSNYDYELVQWYEEGVCEEYEITLPLDVLGEGMWPSVEIDENETYVVWILPSTTEGTHYEMAKSVFTKPYVNVTSANAVYNNLDITLDLIGADEFYVGVASQNEITEMGATTLEEYLTMGGWMPGKWEQFVGGTNSAIGTKYPAGKSVVKLSDLTSMDVEPNTDYHVWVLPYFNDKANSEYDIEKDLLENVTVCKTAPMVFNESLVTTITDITLTPYMVGATATPPAGAKTYYYTFDQEWYESLSEADLMRYLKSGYPMSEAIEVEETYNVGPNTVTYLVTYTVMGGEEGPVQVTELKAPALNYSADIKVNFVSLTESEDGANYTATFTLEGTKNFAGYNISYPGASYSPAVPAFEKYVYKQQKFYYNDVVANEDGSVSVTFAKNSRKTHYLATGYTAVDGVVTAIGTTIVIDLATGTLVDTTANE